jgi:hypothetical protein
VHRARHRAEARARPRALRRRAARIAHAAGRPHARAQPQPIARRGLDERAVAHLGPQPEEEARRDRGLAGRDVRRPDERELAAHRAAARRGDPRLEARLERRVRAAAGGELELRREGKRARRRRRAERAGEPHAARRRQRAAAERRGARDERRVGADPAGGRGGDPRALGHEEEGEEPTHCAPGTGSHARLARNRPARSARSAGVC